MLKIRLIKPCSNRELQVLHLTLCDRVGKICPAYDKAAQKVTDRIEKAAEEYNKQIAA